jgi:signal transduction histidine kinase/ligand-binding sensor domain-containing protein
MIRLVLCLAVLLLYDAKAQDFRLEHIGVEKGLSQGSPYHILKDSRGFMWFGTQDGVNRYDGHSFRIYKPDINNPHALHGVNIAGLVEDQTGNLWIGTEEGLNCYERATERFRLVIGPKQLGTKRRTAPFYADRKELWYLREGEGVLAYNFATQQHRIIAPKSYISQDFDYIDWTVRTPKGDVWMVADKGVVRYDLKQKKYHYYFSDVPENIVGPPLNVICQYIDPQNTVWLGTLKGLVKFNPADSTFQVFEKSLDGKPIGAVYSIAEGFNQRLWLGTQRNGFWNFVKSKDLLHPVYLPMVTPRSLSNYEITRIYVDNRGIIWSNVDPDGLLKIIPNASVIQKVTDTPDLPLNRRLDNFSVRCVEQGPNGHVWIGTEGSLVVFDPKSRTILKKFLAKSDSPTLPAINFIKKIIRDSHGNMWLGTYGGLMKFDPKTETFKLFQFDKTLSRNNYVRTIIELPDGRFFLGTPEGSWLFSPKTLLFEPSPVLRHQNVFAGYYAKDSTVWLASYFEGLYGFKYQNKQWKKTYYGLKAFNINVVREDTVSQKLWVGTEKGLIELDPTTRRYRFYNDRHGLGNSYVYGIIIDPKQQVWLSTNHGISQFDQQSRTFRNFDLADGIQGYEFNGNAFAMTDNGEVYFGGVKGFNSFYPERMHRMSYKPRVHLYNFRVNDENYPTPKQINETDIVTLDYDQNTFSLEFSAIDFYSGGRNAYHYKLDGQDKDWVFTNAQNFVRYANLNAGMYVFKVKAANRDGVWSDDEKKLFVRVKPPFWQTWWFYLFCSGVIGYSAFLAGKNRLQRIRQKEQERLRIALDAQEQERKQIAQDLHDEIGARLATLKLYASSMTKYLPENGESVEMKKKTLEIINESIVDTRRMLRELSPRVLEQYGYAAAVEELSQKIRQSGQVKVELDSSRLPERLTPDIETGLYRITQELLNNTIKHGEAQKITVRVHQDDGLIHFDYFDDGKGFDYQQVKQGLGIGNIESRVAVLGGQIVWAPKVGEGNAVFIEIPLNPQTPKIEFDLPDFQKWAVEIQKWIIPKTK